MAEGEPLLELETEKAVNVVDSPVGGRLAKIVAEAGESYPVGELLAVILAEGEAWDEADLRVQASIAAAAEAPAAAARGARSLEREGAPALRSSPAARRLARVYDLGLADVTGSGPGGRIVVDDVLGALAERSPLPGSRFIMMRGRAVHLLDEGQGTPLLLLHGAGGSNWAWVPVLDRLSSSFRLLAPDLPGAGLSEFVEGDYSLDFYADWTAELLETLGIARAHGAGNSLGAAILVHAAARHKELFDRLVLADSAGLGKGVHPDLHDLLLESDQPEAARASLALLFHDPRLATHGLVEQTLRQRRRPGAMEALTRTMASMSSRGEQLIDVRRDLAGLHTPVLLVWGRQDRVTPLEHAEAAVGNIPDVRLEVLDDCGHVPQAEQPRAFARLVLGFLVTD